MVVVIDHSMWSFLGNKSIGHCESETNVTQFGKKKNVFGIPQDLPIIDITLHIQDPNIIS